MSRIHDLYRLLIQPHADDDGEIRNRILPYVEHPEAGALAMLSLTSAHGGAELWVEAFLSYCQQNSAACTAQLSESVVPWLGLVSAEVIEAEQRIDQGLASSQFAQVVRALALTQTPWEHTALIEGLDHPATREDAAAVLGLYAEPVLLDWLEKASGEWEHIEPVLRVLAAASESYWDIFLDWCPDELWDHECESFSPEAIVFEGWLATHQPRRYAQAFFAGELPGEWFKADHALSDFLLRYGPTSWLETLCFCQLSDNPECFAFAARLAVNAALASEVAVESATLQRHLELLIPRQARGSRVQDSSIEGQALALELELPLALAGEDDVELFVAIGVHERLLHSDFHSPGIAGLPLSATDWDAVDTAAAAGLLSSGTETECSVEKEVRILRTLSDMKRHLHLPQEAWEVLREPLETLQRAPHASMVQAAKAVLVAQTSTKSEARAASGLHQPLEHPLPSGPLAKMLHALQTAEQPCESAWSALVKQWLENSAVWAPFYLQLMEENLQS